MPALELLYAILTALMPRCATERKAHDCADDTLAAYRVFIGVFIGANVSDMDPSIALHPPAALHLRAFVTFYQIGRSSRKTEIQVNSEGLSDPPSRTMRRFHLTD